MPPNAELLATLLAPIPGDSPTGKNLRYADDRYDKIDKARKEDLDLPNDGGLATERRVADWPQVISLSTQLLGKETKDLQLAAWLTEALAKREGFAGLTTGLLLLKGLLEQHWDGLYPFDPDEPDDFGIRAAPLAFVGGGEFGIVVRQTPIAPDGVSFLDEQASQGIPTEKESEKDKEKRGKRAEALEQGKKPPEVVRKAIDGATKAFYKPLVADINAALSALDGLDKVADERFGRDAPGFNALRKALEDVQRLASSILAEKLAADPDPIEEIAPEVAPDEVGAYAPPAGWSGEGGAPGALAPEPTSIADAAGRVAVSARYLRKQTPTSPAPYLMLRGLRWGELRGAMDGVPLDPKLLEAPATAVRAKLKGLLLDGNWTELLEQGEQLMATAQGRGWLDLQRYTLTACARLGSSYDAVAAGVRSELRALLAALPRLPEMTLMDDTPTANPETREWLAAEGLAADGAADAAADGAEAAEDPRAAVLDDALVQDDATSATGGLARARAVPNGRRRADGASLGTPDAFSLARAELAQGRANHAIEVLAAELARTRSPRGRFVRQTQIAYIMVEAGLDAVARPILDKLIEDIDERKLEEWESGALVAQPMALLCRVMDRAGESGKPRNDLYLRICRLDPMQALGLQAG